jgi:hypothetical protein
MKEEIEGGKVVLTPEKYLTNALYNFFDEVVEKANNLSKYNPSIQYEIRSGKFGLDKNELKKVFNSYVKDKTRKTNYTWGGLLVSPIVVSFSYILGNALVRLPPELFEKYAIPFSLLILVLFYGGLSAPIIGFIADYLHDRKAKKIMKLIYKIHIE